MRIFATLVIVIIFTPLLFGQGNAGGTLSGTIIDDATRKPIEFVNTTLRRSIDSSIVTGTVTGSKGKFEITDIPAGEYYVKLSMLGYKEKKTVSFKIDSQHKKANLGTLSLTEMAVAMSEVVVGAEKTTFSMAIDRKVYNVDQDILSKSGSASDLLQNIPSVEVDIEGNVSLRGSTEVLFLINGKTSALMQKSSATVLQQIPANTIEKIEVITNPSAKYKPDGTSGIINIVLKKNSALGINGSTGASVGNMDRYNANVRLNYNPGDYNLFGSYSVRKDNRNRTNTDTRDSMLTHYRYQNNGKSYAAPVAQMIALGGDMQLDEKTSLGLSGNYFYNDQTRNEFSNYLEWKNADVLVDNYDRNRLNIEKEKEYGITAFFDHDFAEEDHTLKFEYKFSQSSEDQDNRYTNIYTLPKSDQTYDNAAITQEEGKNEVTLEYSNPLTNDTKLEAGYVGEFSKILLDNKADVSDQTRQLRVADPTRTNRFDYGDAIHAAYATLKHSFGDFGVLAGLRAEQVYRNSELVTLDSAPNNSYFAMFPTIRPSHKDSYFALFPSLHLSYKFSDAAEMQLNYSRRTRRPEGDDLNPFPQYRDPRNVSSGNPELLPEYTNSVELGCKFQNDEFSILPSIYYRYTYNRFTSIIEALNDTILLSTRTNLSNDQSTGVETIVSASINDAFSAHASATVFYNQIDASNLGYSNNKSVITWSGAMTFNWNVAKYSMIQINSSYSSWRLTPQGENLPSYVVNLGFRQELFDKKLSLILTAADIFKTLQRKGEINTPLFKQTTINLRDSRVVFLGFTYHFGTPAKKSQDDVLKYDDNI